MSKVVIGGVVLGVSLVTYKVGMYANAYYKLKKERKQKVVDLGTYSEYKKKLESKKIKIK